MTEAGCAPGTRWRPGRSSLDADEGHDVLKHGNKKRCYEAIAAFFAAQLLA